MLLTATNRVCASHNVLCTAELSTGLRSYFLLLDVSTLQSRVWDLFPSHCALFGTFWNGRTRGSLYALQYSELVCSDGECSRVSYLGIPLVKYVLLVSGCR